MLLGMFRLHAVRTSYQGALRHLLSLLSEDCPQPEGAGSGYEAG